MSELLKKFVRDLTSADLKKLKKPLGVKGSPYPMMEIDFSAIGDATDKSVITDQLMLVEDNRNPMVLYSDREYGDVQGMATRDMPVPSMLRIMRQAFKRLDPFNRMRVQLYEGRAGIGKTFIAEKIAEMCAPEGALKIDCAGLNAMELLWETVLDFSSDKTFYTELDKRIQNNRLNPRSVAALRNALGDAFHEEDGKITIDWSRVGHSLPEPGAQALSDGTPVYRDSKIASAIARKALQEVSHFEGLSAFGGNALGIKTQKGPIIRCFESGRKFIGDEFNRLKPGTLGVLHGVLQFAIGEIDTCTVINTLKDKDDIGTHSFTFDEKNRRAGWFMYFTQNSETDGSDVNELAQSLNDRIQPVVIPDMTLMDWQHRASQTYTGLPLSTWFMAGEAQWTAKPEDFRKILEKWRRQNERRPIPDFQLRLLQRWENTQEAVEAISKFYFLCSQSLDAESSAHRAGSLSAVLGEINDSLARKLSVGFRRLRTDLQDALSLDPSSTQLSESAGFDVDGPGSSPELEEEAEKPDPVAVLGTSLTKVLMDRLLRDTNGRPHLRTLWLRYAVDCGILQAKLQEGKPGGRRTIAELLDENSYDSHVPAIQLDYIQSLASHYLRSHHPDLSEDNADLVSLESIRRALNALDDKPEQAGAEGTGSGALIVFNADPEKSLPFADAYDYDPLAISGPGIEDPPAVSANELVEADALLGTFAAPILRQHNLTNLFNETISRSGLIIENAERTLDLSLAIAENRSPDGLAVTTLMVRKSSEEEAAVPLHIIWNKKAGKNDRLAIVGDGQITPALQKAFSASRIFYVDRQTADAAEQAKTALTQVLNGDPGKLEKVLKAAFLMRNVLPDGETEKKLSLAELMVDKRLHCFLPHYAVSAG